jgi:hypothetical protein
VFRRGFERIHRSNNHRRLFFVFISFFISPHAGSLSDSVREIVKLGVVASTCRILGYDAGKEENVLKHLTVDAMFLLVSLIVSDCGMQEPASVHDMFRFYNSYRAEKHLPQSNQMSLLMLISELVQKDILQGGASRFNKKFGKDPTEVRICVSINSSLHSTQYLRFDNLLWVFVDRLSIN